MSMTLNEIKAKRQILVDEVMCKVTKIEENYGITRDSVNLMKNEVASLAKYPELFRKIDIGMVPYVIMQIIVIFDDGFHLFVTNKFNSSRFDII